MKYIFIIPLLLFGSSANAATYWVDGSFQDLSTKQVNEKNAYLSQIPDSIMQAKQSSTCFYKYELISNRLSAFDQKNQGLSATKLGKSRDQLIAELNTKYVQPCLKKENITVKSKTNKSLKYEDLEARISTIEAQIQEIMKILELVPGWQRLKG